jgi:hypothetical protein
VRHSRRRNAPGPHPASARARIPARPPTARRLPAPGARRRAANAGAALAADARHLHAPLRLHPRPRARARSDGTQPHLITIQFERRVELLVRRRTSAPRRRRSQLLAPPRAVFAGPAAAARRPCPLLLPLPLPCLSHAPLLHSTPLNPPPGAPPPPRLQSRRELHPKQGRCERRQRLPRPQGTRRAAPRGSSAGGRRCRRPPAARPRRPPSRSCLTLSRPPGNHRPSPAVLSSPPRTSPCSTSRSPLAGSRPTCGTWGRASRWCRSRPSACRCAAGAGRGLRLARPPALPRAQRGGGSGGGGAHLPVPTRRRPRPHACPGPHAPPRPPRPRCQVAVLSNHQNGRDTHVRGVRVFGPRPHPRAGLGFPLSLVGDAQAGAFATVR